MAEHRQTVTNNGWRTQINTGHEPTVGAELVHPPAATADRWRVTSPQVRTVRFAYDNDMRACWHTRLPEFACVANAVSLMMPHVEPFVVRAMREAGPHLEAPLSVEVLAYVAQESQHQREHRRFNDLVGAQWRGLGVLEAMMARTFRALWSHTGEAFHLGYAAATEAVAYGAARWVERHHAELFNGADPQVARLYLWHLAEEVEHKNVAFDAYDARCESRRTLALAMLVSLAVFAWFVIGGTAVGLYNERRLFHPVSLYRLTCWSFGFIFTELPNMLVSVLPGHRPDDFVDPTWFSLYLVGFGTTA